MPRSNHKETEIIGQFASDHFIHAGDPRLETDELGVRAMRGEGDFSFHQQDTGSLFDERDGVYDHATGRTLREPDALEQTYLAGEGMRIEHDSKVLGRTAVRAGNDAADRWMKEHGHSW